MRQLAQEAAPPSAADDDVRPRSMTYLSIDG